MTGRRWPRLAVLDLDDTLVRSSHARRRGRQLLRRCDIDLARFDAVERALYRRFEADALSFAQFRVDRFVDSGLTRTAAIDLDRRYRMLVNRPEPLPGAVRFLKRLRVLGITTVVLTNGDPDPQHAKAERLRPLVDLVLTSREIGFRNPTRGRSTPPRRGWAQRPGPVSWSATGSTRTSWARYAPGFRWSTGSAAAAGTVTRGW
jgi:FMN phosphatase YigB (HAD superfamily)